MISFSSFRSIKWNVLCACILIITIFLCAAAFGYVHLFDWHNIRLGLYGILLFLLTELAMGKNGYKFVSKSALFVLLPYMITFLYVTIQSYGTWKPDLEIVRGYFYIAYSLTVCISVLAYLKQKQKNWLYVLNAIIGCIVAGVILTCLCYLIYFQIYNVPFAGRDMLPVIQTYWGEALTFLSEKVGFWKIGLLIVGLLLYVAVVLKFLDLHDVKGSGHAVFRKVMGGVAFLVSLYSIAVYAPTVFPVKEYRWATEYLAMVKNAQSQHNQLIENLTLKGGKDEALPSKIPGTVLFVIGESETRDHMKAFTPDYPIGTTPWLSQMADNPDFFLLKNGYSNFNHTTFALEMMLTGVNQYNNVKFSDAYNILM